MSAAKSRVVCTVAVAVLAGCTMPFHGAPAPDAYADAATDSIVPPIVQVRSYWRSPSVTVVAWNKEDNFVGLRSSVTLTGDVVGAAHRGDHMLYLTPLYAQDMGGYDKAAIMPGERILVGAGVRRDLYACFYGKQCSPMLTLGVSIPDSILRANRDSLVVTFFPHVNEPWTITLDRRLIAAYLKTVDSIVATTRRSAF